MQDSVDFGRSVARFSTFDAAYVVDVLRGAYSIVTANGGEDEVLADFIDALDECDSIVITDEEYLVDAD